MKVQEEGGGPEGLGGAGQEGPGGGGVSEGSWGGVGGEGRCTSMANYRLLSIYQC